MGFPRAKRVDLIALEQRRIRAAGLLELGISQSEVARRVGAHRQSVSRWANMLRNNGKVALYRAEQVGPKPRLSARDLERVELRLRQGPNSSGNKLWTRRAIANLIDEECGVRYHETYVTTVLRRIGWSLKSQKLL